MLCRLSYVREMHYEYARLEPPAGFEPAPRPYDGRVLAADTTEAGNGVARADRDARQVRGRAADPRAFVTGAAGDGGMRPMTDDADATPAGPDRDDHVSRLQAEIDAVKARRAGYRAETAETVARGGPTRATDEDLGIIKTDDTLGKIAADASQKIGSRLRRMISRFRRRGKK